MRRVEEGMLEKERVAQKCGEREVDNKESKWTRKGGYVRYATQ